MSRLNLNKPIDERTPGSLIWEKGTPTHCAIHLYISNLRNSYWETDLPGLKVTFQQKANQVKQYLNDFLYNKLDWDIFCVTSYHSNPILYKQGFNNYSVNFSIKIPLHLEHDVSQLLHDEKLFYCLPECYFWKIRISSVEDIYPEKPNYEPNMDENEWLQSQLIMTEDEAHWDLRRKIHEKIEWGKQFQQRNQLIESRLWHLNNIDFHQKSLQQLNQKITNLTY